MKEAKNRKKSFRLYSKPKVPNMKSYDFFFEKDKIITPETAVPNLKTPLEK